MNILLTEGGDNVKLADFGLAVSTIDLDIDESTAEAGTPSYTAPEMIERKPYSYPTDCWSFGVVLYQLLTLERPFNGSSTADLVKAVLTKEPHSLPAHYSEEIKLICKELLRKNPDERLTMDELLSESIIFSKVDAFQ